MNKSTTPRSMTNELTVVDNTLPDGQAPTQATSAAPAAPVTAPAASATPVAPATADNTVPAAPVAPAAPVVADNSTPKPSLAAPDTVTVVAPHGVSENILTKAFNNAFNDGAPRRTVYNICDANRILPADNSVSAVTLWSLVTKTAVSQSVNIVRQLGGVTIGKVAACTASAKTLDVSVDYTALLGNYFGTVPICNRTIRRNEMNDSYIRANMQDSAELGIDADILSGAFADNTGLKGIIGDTGTIALAAGKTIGTALGSLLPRDLANAVIVIRPSDWFTMLETSEQLKGCCVVFVNGVPELRYLGARVVPSVVIPDTIYAVVGNFARYIAGYSNVATITADTSVLFAEDKTMFKIQAEACGGSNATKRVINGSTASSFVTIALPTV